jgi:hypothetical protein
LSGRGEGEVADERVVGDEPMGLGSMPDQNGASRMPATAGSGMPRMVVIQ